MKQEIEQSLVRLSKRGDREAFEALITYWREPMTRLAYKHTPNREDAEDVLQSAFFKAWLNIKGFKGESKFSTWLNTIVRNEARMLARYHGAKHNRMIVLDPSADAPAETVSPEAATINNDRLERLLKAVANIPIAWQAPLVMFWLGYRAQEGAAIIDQSEAAYKSKLFRAQRLFWEKVKRYDIAA
jgi:RNA polymerase sigma-70 factor (ECF subfamily)